MTAGNRCRASLLAAFACAFLSWADPGSLQAQPYLPAPRLLSIFPSGAQRGATVDVTVSGSDLDELSELSFFPASVVSANIGSNTFQIVVPTNAELGILEVRAVGRYGVSNPHGFVVGDRREFSIAPTNTSLASAVSLPVEHLVNARTTANSIDYYRIHLDRLERVIVECDAADIDSRFQPSLLMLDSKGHELASSRRSWLDFTSPAAGDYVLKVHDQLFRGSEEFGYRLFVTVGPHLDWALPPILQAGQTNRVALFGRNLPGGKPGEYRGADGRALEVLVVNIVTPTPPSSCRGPRRSSVSVDGFDWRLPGPVGFSNPLNFALTTNTVRVDWPEPLELGGIKRDRRPPESGAAPQEKDSVLLTPPCEFAALFPGRGKVSGPEFRANKGQSWWIEVFADRLGFPCDPVVVLQLRGESTNNSPAKGVQWKDVREFPELETNPGGIEFNLASRDCAGTFEAPQDGYYRLLVRDLFQGTAGPDFPYWLSVRSKAADFRLIALPQPPTKLNNDDRQVHPVATSLRRAEVVPIRVLAVRRNEFGGEISLRVEGLPAEWAVDTGTIPAQQNSGMVFLKAPANSVPWHGQLKVIGSAAVGTNRFDRTACGASILWHVPDFQNDPVASRLGPPHEIGINAEELAPVTLSVITNSPLEVPAGGKISFPVALERRADFQGGFSVKAVGPPELNKVRDMPVPAKTTNAVLTLDLAETKLSAGRHRVWLEGKIGGKYRNRHELADAAAVAAKAAETSLLEAESDVKRLKDEAEKAQGAEKEKAITAVAPAEMRLKKAKETSAAESKRAKELSDRATARDVTFAIYSLPFEVVVLSGETPPKR